MNRTPSSRHVLLIEDNVVEHIIIAKIGGDESVVLLHKMQNQSNLYIEQACKKLSTGTE